jgi:hypothetical protein
MHADYICGGGHGAGQNGWRRIAAPEPIQPGDRRGACTRTGAHCGQGPGSKPPKLHWKRCSAGALRPNYLLLKAVVNPVTIGFPPVGCFTSPAI